MNVLHLEDDPTKARTIRRAIWHLEGMTLCEVGTFKEFQQALVSETEWDLIISDINVPMFAGHTPKPFGREVIGEARRRVGREVPIIFISGDPDYALGDSEGIQVFNVLDQTDWLEAVTSSVKGENS